MTRAQFLELDDDPPGLRLEFVSATVQSTPSQTPEHSHIIIALLTVVGTHIHEKKLGYLFGYVNTIFGEFDVRRPDLLFLAQAREYLIGERAIEGPPDLCVEVISAETRSIDRQDKFRQYAAGGVAFYWIIDPQDRTIEAYRLVSGRFVECGRGKKSDTVRLAPFEDLKIPLSKLWWP